MNADEQQEITDEIIADMIENHEQDSSNDENYVHQKKMMHSKRLSLLEKNY